MFSQLGLAGQYRTASLIFISTIAIANNGKMQYSTFLFFPLKLQKSHIFLQEVPCVQSHWIKIRTSKSEPYGIKHRVGGSGHFLSNNEKIQSRKNIFCKEEQILSW